MSWITAGPRRRHIGGRFDIHLVAALAVGLAVFMNLGTWLHLDREKYHDLDVARDKMQFQARIFGDHLVDHLSNVDMMLDEVATSAKTATGIAFFDEPNLSAMLGVKTLRLDSVSSVILLDRDGKFRVAAGSPIPNEHRLEISAQFDEHRRTGESFLFRGMAQASEGEIGRRLLLSRVVERPDGQFNGIVAAIIPESHFQALHRENVDGDYEFVILADDRGHPLASWWDNPIGFTSRLEARLVKACEQDCGVNPQTRTRYRTQSGPAIYEVAAYMLPDYRVRVFVGRKLRNIFGGRSQTRAYIMAGVMLLSMVVLTIAVLAMSKAFQSARAEERNRKLSLAISGATSGVIVTDARGQLEYINDAFVALSGRTREEITRLPRTTAMPSERRQCVTRQLLEAMQVGKRWQGQISGRRSDGKPYWVAASTAPVVNERGQVEGFIGLAEDITEQKATEEALRLADVVFQTASEAILICDANQTIIRVNPAFETTTGYLAEDVIGKNPKILASGRHDNEFYKDMHDSLNMTDRWEGEIINRKKNGEIFVEWLSINAVKDQEGATSLYASVFMDITKRKATEALIHRQANFDRLTDLPNRHLLQDRLDRIVAEARRHHQLSAVLFVDLDRFKWINDHRGHEIGDRVLVEVANRITDCVRETDTVARIGGDEFVVVLSELVKVEDADRVAHKILTKLDQPLVVDHGDLHISGSIGVAMFPADGDTSEELLRKADQAMYRAKSVGRNAVRFFEPQMNEEAERRANLTSKLHAACLDEKVVAYYQPIFCMETGRYVGAECLARWDDEGTIVSPGVFIPIAEDNGQIDHVFNSVLANVGRDMARWQDQIPDDFYFTLNIAPRQFFSVNLVTSMLRFLGNYGLKPRQFVLEITENVGLEDRDEAFARIAQLRDLGFRIALDDFGAGYSSLGYLQSLAVDILKIDRAFVNDLPGSLESRAIIETVAVLSKRLGIRTVAEGVSQDEQLDYLQGTGCTYGQGFLVSKPLSPEVFLLALDRNLRGEDRFHPPKARPALKLLNGN